MELAGVEKRIQALFSELTLEDQSGAPTFEKVWNRAEFAAREPGRRVRRSFVVITTAVVMSVSLTLGLLYRRSLQPDRTEASKVSRNSTTVMTRPIPTPERFASAIPPRTIKSIQPIYKRSHRKQTSVARDATVTKAATIASWQSPTAILMESPGRSFLKSVPELNQSVRDLQSFLTDNQPKELNQ